MELVRPSMRATLRLLPQKRFEVVVPYDKQTIEVFKKTPTNTYSKLHIIILKYYSVMCL